MSSEKDKAFLKSQKQRDYRKMRRDKGLCADCGKPKELDYVICISCSNTRRSGNKFSITLSSEVASALREHCNRLNVRVEQFIEHTMNDVLQGESK